MNNPARNLSRKLYLAVFCLLLLFSAPAFSEDSAPAFDLIGPRVQISVSRSGKALPVSNVSDLEPGDKLHIRPEFPDDQAVHYLLIVAFLQGSTNPPPETWFTRAETWNKQVRQQGITVTVPQGAEQAILFLAPETGGDFTTLRSSVRGRPGVFVRATEDLEQASLDRTRLDKYLAEIQKISNSDPKALKERSTVLAQALRVKINEDCFSKPEIQQTSCLTEDSAHLVIDDAHGESLVATLTSGPSSDLIGALGASPAAKGGYYSPYVGAVVDAVRLLNNLHTAAYQYIPALSLPERDHLNLKLNSPPSFHNPKSVLVVGLPPIGQRSLPRLRPALPEQILCLQHTPLVVAIEGEPLVYSTSIAHDFVFRVGGKSGEPVDLPATPDATRGGFVVDTHALTGKALSGKLEGTLRGYWGFSAFDGPELPVRSAHPGHWILASADTNGFVVGHVTTLHLEADCAACVEKLVMENASGQSLTPTWKNAEADQLQVALPLKDEHPGPLKLKLTQYGVVNPDVVPLQAFDEPARPQHFTINAGDTHGFLTGTRLDEVACLELKAVCFSPEAVFSAGSQQSLDLVAQNPGDLGELKAGSALSVRVTLKDGRVLNVPAVVAPPRPKVTLVSKNVQQASVPSPIRFGNPDELSQDGKLSFYLKTEIPEHFPHNEKIEVATLDGAYDATLSLADGNLILQDSSSVLAVVEPAKAASTGAFGALRLRPVDVDGAKGDWQSLAVLVRTPSLKEVRCPDAPDQPCILHGSNLFLLDSVASDREFKNAVQVPAGYMNATLTVPRPNGTLLYIRLRDNPTTVDVLALPVLPENQ